MSKDEMVQHLKDNGYRAENENGVVMIRVDTALTAKEINELHKLIRDAGYDSSYGWSVRKDNG